MRCESGEQRAASVGWPKSVVVVVVVWSSSKGGCRRQVSVEVMDGAAAADPCHRGRWSGWLTGGCGVVRSTGPDAVSPCVAAGGPVSNGRDLPGTPDPPGRDWIFDVPQAALTFVHRGSKILRWVISLPSTTKVEAPSLINKHLWLEFFISIAATLHFS